MYVLLAAALAVGWRRERRLLWPILLAIASVVAFQAVKETWFLAVVSAGALADGWGFQAEDDLRPLGARYRLAAGIELQEAAGRDPEEIKKLRAEYVKLYYSGPK